MIDLHNSSKYKVAYTFNKEDSKTPSNTGSEIQLEVQDCRTAGLQVFQSDIVKCTQSPASLVLPKNSYFPCNI